MKNATIQLKGRQSVKTPSVRLLSGCCQVTRLGEAQLSIVGKGSKSREVLIPAVITTCLFANRGNAPASAPVFRSVRQPGYPLTERAINFIVKEAAERAGVNLAASIHWLRHAHASHAIYNDRCGRQATLSEGG